MFGKLEESLANQIDQLGLHAPELTETVINSYAEWYATDSLYMGLCAVFVGVVLSLIIYTISRITDDDDNDVGDDGDDGDENGGLYVLAIILALLVIVCIMVAAKNFAIVNAPKAYAVHQLTEKLLPDDSRE